ncbi:MAG: hypothetical protein ACM3YO_03510, partial [Bacteroidota bacterium]
MTSIRPNTGLAPVYPQTMPLGPKPPTTQELDPTLNEDSASITAQPQAASLADLVAKAKAAQAPEETAPPPTAPEEAKVAPEKPEQQEKQEIREKPVKP